VCASQTNSEKTGTPKKPSNYQLYKEYLYFVRSGDGLRPEGSECTAEDSLGTPLPAVQLQQPDGETKNNKNTPVRKPGRARGPCSTADDSPGYAQGPRPYQDRADSPDLAERLALWEGTIPKLTHMVSENGELMDVKP